MIEEVIVLLEDETQPVPRRLMRAVTHLVREQARIDADHTEKLMTIQDTIDALANAVAADVDELTSEIAALKAENPTADTSRLEAVVGRLTALATENATPAPEPSPEPATAPEPTPPVDPPTTEPEPAPPAADPEPQPTNPDGSPIAPPPPNSAQFQPLYVVDGDVNGDPSNWSPFPNYVTLDGRPLFTFSGDAPSPGASPTGDGLDGTWHLYSGDLAATS